MSGLADWKRQALSAHGVDELFHVTSLANLAGVLRDGIRSRSSLQDTFDDIALADALGYRAERQIFVGKDHSYRCAEMVPLFFTPTTPMTYLRRAHQPGLCCIGVDAKKLCADDFKVAFSDGNLASRASRAHWSFEQLAEVPWHIIRADSWTHEQADIARTQRRQRAAEFLVAGTVPTSAFRRIYVRSRDHGLVVSALNQAMAAPVKWQVKPEYFFR